MKIVVSVGGRFHAFNLAQQLLKSGYLERLITSYPKFLVKKWGIPAEKTKSIFIKEILQRSANRFPPFLLQIYNPQFFIDNLYDRLAARRISDADIFVGFFSCALHSIRRAKKSGMKTVLDHGSSHLVYQRDVLKEEYERFGQSGYLPHPKTIKNALFAYEEADYIGVPSLFVKRTFLEKGIPESKLIHVPYGVDLRQFKQVPKEDKIFRVVFAGGMTLRKGVHYLLRAFSELNLPNSELMLIGAMANEMKPFFKNYEGQFNYVGRKNQSELYQYYSQGSVFVLMSIEEGLAIVQPQAMACGLPVICSANTGGEDIVRDGKDGFVIPIRDVNKLKEKLLDLYNNQEICREMGQSAKARVSSGFTWDDYGIKTIAAYQRILSSK